MRLSGYPRKRRRACRRSYLTTRGGVEPNQRITLEEKNLTPETAYLILAAAVSGNTYSPVATLAMTTGKKEDPKPNPYTELIDIEAYYMGDTAGAGNYILKFATASDASNRWSNVYFGLWTSEIPQDFSAISLPTGTFLASTDRSAGTFDPEYTFQRVHPEETVNSFTGGSVVVAETAGVYTITGDFVDAQNNSYKFRYEGAVGVEDQSPHHLPQLNEDVDARFYLATGTYFGDYYVNGTSLVPIAFTSEYAVLNVEFLTAGIPYSTDVLQPGTYTVNADHSEWTLTPGEEYNYAGWEYRAQGTYCRLIGKQDTYGFATGGTIDVQRSGNQYTVTVDLTASNGKKITGTYTGAITINDGTEKPVISELEEDRVVDLSAVKRGRMEYSGEWYQNGMNDWTIYVKDESIDEVDGMIFDFNMPPVGFLPEGIPAGTYSLSSVAMENTMVPGFINTYLAGTWYIWDNHNNRYGKKAPIATGSLTIGKEGDIWTLDFEMYDDARPAHKISGRWSGPMNIINAWD